MAPPRKVVREQLEILVGCLEQNKDMMKVPSGALVSYQSIRQKWTELAKKLNSIFGGALKTPDAWRKYWFEFRHKCRKKAADGRRFQSGADVGRNKFVPLNDLEIRVLELSGTGFVAPTVPESQKLEEFLAEDSESDKPLNNIKIQHKEQKRKRIKVIKKDKDASDDLVNNSIFNSDNDNFPDGSQPYDNGDSHPATPPPKWAIELEERRIRAQEQMAEAVAAIAAVMQSQEERRALLDERTADALTALAGTVQDLNSGVHEAVHYLQQLHEKNKDREFDDKSFAVNKDFYQENE